MPRSNFFFSAILAFMLVGPGTTMAAETQGGKPEAAAPAGEDVPQCQKKVDEDGRPHRLSTVASLSAIRAWAQMAMKYGEDYAMWHNAESARVKCKKLPRSDYFLCSASGKPCPAGTDGKTASNQGR